MQIVLKHSFVFVSLLIFLVGKPASGQLNPAVSQSNELQRRQQLEKTLKRASSRFDNLGEIAPELFEGELEDVGQQNILKVKRRKRRFDVQIDSQFLYTSNTALEENGNDSTLLVNTIYLAYAPDATPLWGGQLLPSIGYRHQFFNYGLMGSAPSAAAADFDSQAIVGQLQLRTTNNWTFSTGLEYARLLDHDPSFSSYKEFYREWVPRYLATKFYYLSETRFFGMSYQGAYHITDSPRNTANTSAQDRLDQGLLAAYTHAFGPTWTVQPFTRAVYTHYTDQQGRDDFLVTVGGTVFYTINEWLTARAFVSYDVRETDIPTVPDYQKLDMGIALGVNKRF
jgi:hypothetical protein